MSNFSIYCAGYNLIKNSFDIDESLRNFCSFADEVVLATTVFTEDESIELLKSKLKEYPNLRLVITDFSFDNYAFDGLIKNAALQETSKKFKICLDLDERIPLYQKDLWEECSKVLDEKGVDSFLIPSINLCGDVKHYKDIGYKWYLHKSGLKRGIVSFAKLDNGKIDIKRSDTCELLLPNDELVSNILRFPNSIEQLYSNRIPFIFHLWGVNIKQRIIQNKFWKPVWENRSGAPIDNVLENELDIASIPIYNHQLRLWNE